MKSGQPGADTGLGIRSWHQNGILVASVVCMMQDHDCIALYRITSHSMQLNDKSMCKIILFEQTSVELQSPEDMCSAQM
jgi:hypothetical protein